MRDSFSYAEILVDFESGLTHLRLWQKWWLSVQFIVKNTVFRPFHTLVSNSESSHADFRDQRLFLHIKQCFSCDNHNLKFRESVFVEAIKSIKSIDLGNYLGNLHYLSSTSYGIIFIKIWEPRGRDPPVLSQSLGEMRHMSLTLRKNATALFQMTWFDAFPYVWCAMCMIYPKWEELFLKLHFVLVIKFLYLFVDLFSNYWWIDLQKFHNLHKWLI